MTINELLKEHPEYGDLDVVIYSNSGEYDYLGSSGTCYVVPEAEWDPDGKKLLVFSGN